MMGARKRKLSELPRYDDCLMTALQNQKEAEGYLQSALALYQEEGEIGCLLLAIRDVVKAQGGMTTLAQKTNLSRESLYKALSDSGNPQFSTVWTVLHSLGFHLVIESLNKAA